MFTPEPNESEKAFVDRCVPIMLRDGSAKTPEQAVALCQSLYRQHADRQQAAAKAPPLVLLTEPGAIIVQAAAAGDPGSDPKVPAKKLPTFSMLAYSGGAMRVAAWRYPVVVDLAGLALPRQNIPIRLQHDPDQGVGHTTRVAVENNTLVAGGVVSRDTGAARDVVNSGANGFPWQASIGASVEEFEFIRENKKVQVNGRTFDGPVNVIRQATLGEISFVDSGADPKADARVAANRPRSDPLQTGATTMKFEEWLKARGFAPEGLAEDQRKFLQSAYDAEQAEAAAKAKTPAEPKADDPAAIRAAAALEERKRIATVEAACRGFTGQRVEELRQQAVDGTITPDDLRAGLLEHVRSQRAKNAGASAVESDGVRKAVLAAAYLAGGLNAAATAAVCGAPALEAAAGLRGMGLQEFCARIAASAGVELPRFRSDPHGWLAAAFSTADLSGILSNVANKFLLAGYTSVEESWRQVASVRSVRDFKAYTAYRMTGSFQFEEIGPDGELKHEQVGEEWYSGQAKTYGRMFVVTRQDLVNDDLGAITDVPRRIGRGGGLKLNDVFWARWLNNSSFFTTDRANYKAGATTALSFDGLSLAVQMFADQTDSDGKPLGLTPRKLLVPSALAVVAQQLYKSVDIRDPSTSGSKYGVANVHGGLYLPVASAYLANAVYTGYSAKAWYLTAAPEDAAAVEVAFLNGVQTPTVERVDAEFNVLGIGFRGYFDFGVAQADHRAAVKMKGEA